MFAHPWSNGNNFSGAFGFSAHRTEIEYQKIFPILPSVKRTVRIAARILAGLLTLGAMTGVVCLDGVDARPYFHESYYANTAARLRALEATNQLTRGALAAGFGRA